MTEIAPSSLDPLRNRVRPSGFRNVYYCRNNQDGEAVYCAKIKRGRRLMRLCGSGSTDPAECARHVANWYAREYGPDWPAVLAARKINPWKVKQNPEGPGFYALVWIRGKRHEVVPLVWHPPAPVPLVWSPLHPDRLEVLAPPAMVGGGTERQPARQCIFPTREAARAGLWAYAVRVLGLDGLPEQMARDEMVLSLYRTDKPRNRWMGKAAV